MKRERTPPDSQPVTLLPELMALIGAQLDEPWFLDLRTFLRWQQCSRVHWAAYCARPQEALHYVLTQKRERQTEPCDETRHLEATLNCARLTRAITQSALLVAIESDLRRIPRNVKRFIDDGIRDPLAEPLQCSEALDLNALINFKDYTNAHAIAVLEWCRQYVHARYGWYISLRLGIRHNSTLRGVVKRPWEPASRPITGIVMAFSPTDDAATALTSKEEILNSHYTKWSDALDPALQPPRTQNNNYFHNFFNDLLAGKGQ